MMFVQKCSTMTGLLATVLVALCQMHSTLAWISSGNILPRSLVHRSSFSNTELHQSSSFSSSAETPMRRRAAIEGVSIAPQGFWVMLRVAQNGYLPWQVTDDPLDAHAATSPEALTLIQLLSGVDMAGAILPPDVLARLVVLHCERLAMDPGSSTCTANDNGVEEQQMVARDILSFVQDSLPNATVAYSQVHPWVQSRVKLPTASLDEVLVNAQTRSFSLSCTVRKFGSLTLTPTPDMLESVLYQFSAQTSLAFTSLALALRYQAPISVQEECSSSSSSSLDNSYQYSCLETIQTQFPMYATVSTLQKSSNRVKENIERGFEIHKLQGALRIAMERGDLDAATKIRAALDDYDSLDQLPTAGFDQEDGGLLQRNCTMADVLQ